MGVGEKVTGIWPLTGLFLESVTQGLGSPEFLIWLVLAVLLVYWQYRRQATFVAAMWGSTDFSAWQETLDSLAAGALGGLLAAALLVGLGVSLSDGGLLYLWPLALVLMLVHPRYLCFSYGGGLLAAWKMLTGSPASVHIPALIGLVAVLHGVEAFLIAWTGASRAQPIYVRRSQGGTVGGYLLQRLWPLPTLGIALVWLAQNQLSGVTDALRSVPTPAWWPLLASGTPTAGTTLSGLGDVGSTTATLLPVLIILPVVAALGYSDLTVTQAPRRKAHQSAAWLGAYSLALLGLALLAQLAAGQGPAGQALAGLAALAMPLGHEAVIYLGQRAESRGVALFGPDANGVAPLRVMAVMPGSPASRMGLQLGDTLVRVNGEAVADIDQLRQALLSGVGVVVEIQRQGRTVVLEHTGRATPLGVVLTPKPDERVAVPLLADTFYDVLVRWRRGGHGGDRRES